MKLCSINGCQNPRKGGTNGMCPTHTRRAKLGIEDSESPLYRRMFYATPEERLAAYVKRGESNECWEWQRGKQKGYGALSVGNGKYRRAHVVAWEQAHGETLPPGMVIRHTCDNRACCNPAHLRLGTQKDNMADKVARGRQPRGEKMATSKLTQTQVEEIRTRYQAGGIRQKDLAAEYGTTQSNISFLVRGITWASPG